MTDPNPPSERPTAYALRGICFIGPKDTHQFSGTLRYELAPATPAAPAWKARLDTWRSACAHRTGQETTRIRELQFDPVRGTLSFRVTGVGMVRPVHICLRRRDDTEWIGTWKLLGLPDERKYACRCLLAPLPTAWENAEGILEEFTRLEERVAESG